MAAQYNSADFSQESADKKSHFMHEMTHVWQHSSGRSVIGESIVQFVKNGGDYHKAYKDDGKTDFNKMNLEQQADLVASYYGGGGPGFADNAMPPSAGIAPVVAMSGQASAKKI